MESGVIRNLFYLLKRVGGASKESGMSRRGYIVVVITSVLFITALLGGFLVLSSHEAEAFSGGNGTAGDPWLITNVSELQDMNLYLDAHDAHYALNQSIDASATAGWVGDFVPIGNISDPFTGTFNGNGHTITGLLINRLDISNVGLFGAIGASGTVSNVGLINVNIHGNNFVGGLVGRNY